MEQQTKDLIERRAHALARICERILNFEDETDEVAGAGFRWAYLILRRPRKYLEAFQAGDLRIDPSLLTDAIWHFQEQLPGPNGLLPEEREILKQHNDESARWMQSRPGVISLTKTQTDVYA